MSTKAIAFALGMAFKTAACHRYRITAKLGASNAADLVCRAIRLGLVNVPAPTPGARDHHQELADQISDIVVAHREGRRMLAEALSKQKELQRVSAATRREHAEVRQQTRRLVAQLTKDLGQRDRSGSS